MRVEITSFGHLHGPVPEAEVVLDLRRHFRDPHVRTELRHKTAKDPEVREAVLSTPGIPELVAAAVAVAQAYAMGPQAELTPFRVAVGCAGGRHRAAAVAEALAEALAPHGLRARVQHRDLDKPVVEDGRDASRTEAYADVIENALDQLLDDMGGDVDELDVSVAAENAAMALVNAGY
ncbi:ATPase [Kitasatospora sp. NPDC059648]|uniref:RapZ C-terminal domain-containing protein n=1 Tax=Kitasatospora sp. NPDC059648 TaxID=3346894 RepID=UPI0036A16020